MCRQVAVVVLVVFLLSSSPLSANLNSLSFLGETVGKAVQSNGSAGTPFQMQINSIQGPGGNRQVDFPVYNHQGQQYVDPQSFNQIFPGTTVSQQGNNYSFNRGNQQLNVVIIMQSVIIIFLGMQMDSGFQTYQNGNNTCLPLNGISQFFNQSFNQSGNSLVQTQNNGLQSSWQQFLQQNGANNYTNQISNAQNQTNGSTATNPKGKVFRNITCTVFDSQESGLKGAYGEYLRPNDYFVALPKRFSGRRPKVAVRGPRGTVVAEIKDVGPWNINDPYWETGRRPQAESGYDLGQTRSGRRRTNLAGIDISPRMGREIGIGGKGKVDWWFVD